MKINRLLEITLILLNKETITAKVLAERFDVSTRTIYRDLDVLSAAGVPIYTNKGKGGGISLLDNYSLNKTYISEQEGESILLALKTLQAAKYPDIDMIFDKLGSMFKSIKTDDWVEVDFSPWGTNPNMYHKFDDIKKAILSRRVIKFRYINAWNKKSTREVEPLKLFFKGQSWYLRGYCRHKSDFRTFRITRMKDVVLTEEIFQRRDGLQESDHHGEYAESQKLILDPSFVNLKLKFQSDVLYRIYDDYDEEHIQRNQDGTYEVNITIPEDEWLYGYIMSYGCFVEVIEPVHIRDIIMNRLSKTINIYK